MSTDNVEGGNSRQLWIDLCQQCNVDPRQLVINNLSNLLELISNNSESNVRISFEVHLWDDVS